MDKLYGYIGAAFLEWLELIRNERQPQGMPDHIAVACDIKDCWHLADFYGYHRMLDGAIEPTNVCDDHYNTLMYCKEPA